MSDDDGFDPFDVDELPYEVPELPAHGDPGSANLLGWDANYFADDPQYGIFRDELIKPAATDSVAAAVFIAVLGDAASEVRAPTEACLRGCRCTSVVFSEAEVLGNGIVYGPELLEEEAGDAEVRYLIIAPGAQTFSTGVSGKTHDSVSRDYDRSVRHTLEQLVVRLPAWKVLVVVPCGSTWADTPAWSSGPGRWITASVNATEIGLPGAPAVRTRTRHWAAKGVSADSDFAATSSTTSSPTTPSWPSTVRRVVAKYLAAELETTAGLVSTVAGAVADVLLASEGKVQRHVMRGPPLWDPRAARLAEDVGCPAGLRDPGELWRKWPALWSAMEPIADVIYTARRSSPDLRGLTRCLGADRTREPPAEPTIAALRALVAERLGLDSSAAERHHRYSTWRHQLVKAIQTKCLDPDTVLPAWLEFGAPMGIRRPLQPGGGIFPTAPSPRSVPPDVVLAKRPQRNHASFREKLGGALPPGHDVVQQHVSAGFGLLFANQSEAEKHLGSKIAAAPLGCITKTKENGTLKHRVIQDLKANDVNLACSTPERQVLPTVYQHARDITVLGNMACDRDGVSIGTLVLDIENAFMGVPLDPAEQPFNACAVDYPLVRGRDESFPGEVATGAFVVWNVLGFGGKPNPLVFARIVGFAARTGQALFRPARDAPGCPHAGHARLQMYVDDPIFSVAGNREEQDLAVDLLLLWWMVLGVPLAWSKGTWSTGTHRWIGADFEHLPRTSPDPPSVPAGPAADACRITVPAAFVDALFDLLAPLAEGSGHLAEGDLEAVLGKCGRLSYLVPSTRPFVTSLWGAFTASRSAAAGPRREAPPGRHAARIFSTAALWLRTLLRPPADLPGPPLLPLETIITENLKPIALDGPSVQVDASPWGGGAVLLIDNVPVEHASCTWSSSTAAKLGVELGSPNGQTAWEYMIIWLALETWGSEHAAAGLAILGDNMAALNGAISMRGRAEIARITRELAWRKTRRGWRYACGHLPAEANDLADCLSRLTAPEGNSKSFPAALAATVARTLPDPESLWIF